MELRKLVKHLDAFGNLETAKVWDNVGLLVEPSGPLFVKSLLVTNDLTESVLEEAFTKQVQLIVAYHPAIFKPLKRFTQDAWKQRSIVQCIEHRVAVYSPHTTWDAINIGINDWILQAFDVKRVENVVDIKRTRNPCGFEKTVMFTVSSDEPKNQQFISETEGQEGVKFLSQKDLKSMRELEFLCSARGVATLMERAKILFGVAVLDSMKSFDLDKPLMKNEGHGRIGYLNKPIQMKEVVNVMKRHLGMKTFRIALGHGKTLETFVESLAIGAGTCSGLLNGVHADCIITGEFTHHEIMDEVHRGVSVIVTDHTRTERGFTRVFKQSFEEATGGLVEVIISEKDRDPLEYV